PLVFDLHLPGLIGAQNFLWYYMQQMALSNSPVLPDRTPILQGGTPETFIDNYFSEFGFGTDVSVYGLTATDVFLKSLVLYPLPNNLSDTAAVVAALFGGHDYPPPWYAQASLQNKNTTDTNGLGWSPLIDSTAASNLKSGTYQQTWTSNVFNKQFE